MKLLDKHIGTYVPMCDCPSLRYGLCKDQRITIPGNIHIVSAMQSSTFGQILGWVHDQLKQVETNMAPNNSGESQKSVAQARQSIEILRTNREHGLEEECRRIAEAEYNTLIVLLQNREPPTTPDIDQLSEEI